MGISFLFEDTKIKTTKDVKTDMESPHPMDRLIWRCRFW